jgi:lysozyme
MKTSAKGCVFITQQERCGLHAYRDAVGVWTIGVGQISMAGLPHVNPGMTISARRPLW